MDEVIEHKDPFYIVAGDAPADARTLVLNHGEMFAIFNSIGDIESRGPIAHGIFCHGMRHLSRMRLRLDGVRPVLLSSKVTDDNTRIIIDLTNPDESSHGQLTLPRGTLHLLRSIFLWDNACFEQLTVTNFAAQPVDVAVSLTLQGDFADIFEVRGLARQQRGQLHRPLLGDGTVVLGYEGLDGVTRRTRIDCAPKPVDLSDSQLRFHVQLQPRCKARIHLTVACEAAPSSTHFEVRHERPAGGARGGGAFRDNLRRMTDAARSSLATYCQIDSRNRSLTQWMRRSCADVDTLITTSSGGLYPYAGVPWFSTPFGRDGLITAMQMLWVNPQIARGVLLYLAAHQATDVDPQRDAEPGKILHERRTNEMAATGEVPFGQYYGSVDSTPLFVMLAGDYWRTTGDLQLIRTIWPNIERALAWIDDCGDSDGDGFVEYQRHAHNGLTNQGWKDSHDSVFHADGSLASTPIALCEVQGYVYAARQRASELARALDEPDRAADLAAQAARLKQRFNDAFWLEELQTFAVALDGDKRPCAVRTSNPGHCLFTEIVDDTRTRAVCQLLMDRTMFCGWGVRTVASTEARYNPMSYHNGSIWPHDNALIAMGLARNGFRHEAWRICNGWFEASTYLDLHRLPELCCGFRRRGGKGPTLYPVACSPQAWAAGAAFMLLAACLGLTVDGSRHQLRLDRPQLPRSVTELRIRNLRVGGNVEGIDLLFQSRRSRVTVEVLRPPRDERIQIIVTK